MIFNDTISFSIVIRNLIDITNECGTMEADSFLVSCDIFYQEQNAKEFKLIGTCIYNIPSLIPQQSYSLEFDGVCNKNGCYYWNFNIDSENTILERDETNNSFISDTICITSK